MLDELRRALRRYDDATADVRRSNSSTARTNLNRWFEVVDESEALSRVATDLEAIADIDVWLGTMETRARGGSGVDWPRGERPRLGIQLALLRRFTAGKPSMLSFARAYLGKVNTETDAVHLATDHVFTPLARDLRGVIEETYEGEQRDAAPIVVPASDRIVTLDHNKPEYVAVMDALDEVVRTVRETNEYPSPDDKEQRLAEVAAAQRLLSAPRVRTHALRVVLGGALLWFADHFAAGLIGKAAERALEAVTTLLGSGWWPL